MTDPERISKLTAVLSITFCDADVEAWWRLTMDRTNWRLGRRDVNILMIPTPMSRHGTTKRPGRLLWKPMPGILPRPRK